MDAALLVDPNWASASPAPFWFVQFFKALGFTLHAVPMNLWYAGMIVALWLHLRGSEPGRRFGGRLLRQMPVIVAIGVNLGIVPLLFVQLAYFKVFYPATILMAWSWLAIIALLIPAYYGVYAYAWGLRNEAKSLAAWRIAAGWIAAIFFIVIGFLYANGLSLMAHVERWPELWTRHSTSGAASGTALNLGDPTLWPRWLLMFGLALGTTAVWALVDAFWFVGQPDQTSWGLSQFSHSENGTVPLGNAEYQRWAVRFARKLYTVGMIWFAAAGTWYVFGTWSDRLQSEMFAMPVLPITVLTAVAMGLPWLLMMGAIGIEGNSPIFVRTKIGTVPWIVAAIAVCQVGVLGLNATSRQIVQNLDLKPYFDFAAQPVDVEWGPLVMFLVVFVLGLATVGWMLVQVRKAMKA